MNTKRWQVAKEILHSALDLPASQRKQFVEVECASDLELRAEIEELLAEHKNLDSFLEPPRRGERDWRGTTLVHRYRIEDEIGAGGFGQVFSAADELGGERVAVKIYRANAAHALPLFRREIATLRWLRLPGIVQLFDEGVEEGCTFIVMEIVDGRPFPGRSLPATWEDIRTTTLSLVESVGRLHWAGVIHCDLKPNNVLVRDDGSPVLLDLGISAGPAVTGTAPLGSGIAGTPRYIAPERFHGAAPDPRCDLFSIGVMIYEALARPGTEGNAQVQQTATWPEPWRWSPLKEAAPGVPDHVAKVVDQLLLEDPRKRPETAAQLLDLLEDTSERRGILEKVARLGSDRPLIAIRTAARERRSLTIRGATGSGRSRLLRDAAQWLRSEQYSVREVPSGRMPLGGLRAAFPAAVQRGDDLSLAEAEATLESELRNRLRGGEVLLVDDIEQVDSRSRKLLEACRLDGCILTTTTDGDADHVLQPLGPEDLQAIFAGPDRVHHLRSDAAQELWRRTSGSPGRVERELEAWIRAGLARLEGGSIVVRRTALERLRVGLYVGASAPPENQAELTDEEEELLVWIDAADGQATAQLLGDWLKQPRWRLEAAAEALLDKRAIQRLKDGRLRGLWPTHGGRTWTADRSCAMHSSLADASPLGKSARFRHLLAARRLDDLASESLLLAESQLQRGAVSSAESTLVEGMRWSIASDGDADPGRFLIPLLDTALTSGTSRSLDRLLHYCLRLDPEDKVVRAVESIARAALWTYRNDAHRALDETATAQLEDAVLERCRHAVRVHAASTLGADKMRDVVNSAVRWAKENESSAQAHAAQSEWIGWLCYTEGEFENASRHHSAAAESAPTAAKRSKSYADAAWAALELFDLKAVEELAILAFEAAAHCRHAHYEARAESLTRIVNYRMESTDTPDLALVDATALLGVSHVHGIVTLTEAAVAWRSGQTDLGRELAERAARELRNAGSSAGELLAIALGVVCGRTLPRDFLSRTRTCDLPGVKIQLLGMLARSGTRIAPSDRDLAHAAAETFPQDTQMIRRELVSVGEALRWIDDSSAKGKK